MVLNQYLVINDRGTCRISKKRPNLKQNEICMRLHLEIPFALFTKPQLEASIKIPDSAVTPRLVSEETINNIEELIMQSQGLQLKINVIQDGAETN